MCLVSFGFYCVALVHLLVLLLRDTHGSAEYIVQGHRFNIYEELGCYPAIVNTILAYLTCVMWPAIIGLCSAVYGGWY